MPPVKKNVTAMFFTPHPDDIELGVPFMYIEALKLGYNVIEVLMTNGEFGTNRADFKGKRLTKIRMRELDNANKVFEKYTNNKIKVVKMGYIDGYLPLNKESLKKVVDLIRTEKPHFIFAPDPIFPQDYHPDHVNTGRLVYLALKKLKKSNLPKKIFYYYSTRTKFYLKCKWKDFKIIREALAEHKTQYSPLANKLIILLYNKLSIFRHLIERGSFSESFREQKFKDGKPIAPRKFNAYETIVYYSFSKVTLWGYTQLHNMTPEELGLQ